jgi:hypothetical protein
LNNPPTAVGGIPKVVIEGLLSREDRKYPPTAVGGFKSFRAKPVKRVRFKSNAFSISFSFWFDLELANAFGV